MKQIREDELNAPNRLMREGTEALGWSGFVARHNREGCIRRRLLHPRLQLRRQEIDAPHLRPPPSKRTGRASTRVRGSSGIEAHGSGRSQRIGAVHGHAVGPGGETGVPFTIEAPVVVLAAGAVASPDILLRSELANGSGQVGKNLHLHPSVMAAGFFEEELHGYRGIPRATTSTSSSTWNATRTRVTS